MHFFQGPDAEQPLLAHLGPEPLTDELTGEYLYAQTRRRTVAIKQALMDNTLVVGVGNIYANEALFRAGIHPDRAANRVSRARYKRLVMEVKAVLTEAIAAGGSTLRDFVNTAGEPGYFQLDYFVYGRHGQPCKVCATPLRLMRHGGRATVFCSTCQR
jgi:formamidopyrimidine-DNA glycosylase